MKKSFLSVFSIIALVVLPCASLYAQEPGYIENKPTDADKDLIFTVSDKLCSHTMPMIESRGVWLTWHDYVGPKENTLKKLDEIKDMGLNTVYVCTTMRGYAVYPDSEYLPQWPDIQTSQPDVLKWLVPEIKDRGLRCECWPEYGFYAYWDPNPNGTNMGPWLTKQPELCAIDATGQNAHIDKKFGKFYAACAANPKSHEFLIGLTLEHLKRYPFDGVNVDRIRWTNDKFCYCDYCKTEFKKRYGYDLNTDFKDPKQITDRDEFRCAATASFIKKLRKAMKQAYPDKILTADVVPPEMIREKGQDWYSWVKDGDVDAVIPMLYRPNIAKDIATFRKELGNDAPIFVGLDASNKQDKFCDQVSRLRAAAFPGLTIWVSNTLDKLEPNIKDRLFWRPAKSPFDK